MVACRDLRWVHGSIAAVSILTRPTLGDSFLPTRPTDCFAIDYPGRALFPGSDGEHLHDPSKLACISWGRGWIDLLLRAWTSTAFLKIRWIWCARSASKGDQPAHTPLPLRSQAAIVPCGFTHRRSRGDRSLLRKPAGHRRRVRLDIIIARITPRLDPAAEQGGGNT
jgi:hypothetical protein